MRRKAYITDYNCITPLGASLEATVEAMWYSSGIKWVEETSLSTQGFYAAYMGDRVLAGNGFTRLENMMVAALEPVVKRNRVGEKSLLLVSTTKGNVSSLQATDAVVAPDAYLFSLAQKINKYFGFVNEPLVISNACVSGIMAVSVAKRLVSVGKYDRVYIVAGDEVSEFVLSGFKSFQAVSSQPCKPYSANRDGITLGEAAAAALVSAEEGFYQIAGDGNINDANHISGPSRTGEGLFRSIKSALTEANLSPNQIDVVSAHGTATLYNDEMEAIALDRLGMNKVPINSLKGYFGHTLGASGLLEAVVTLEAAKENRLFSSYGFDDLGVSAEIAVLKENLESPVKHILKTASGFGGCNSAVIFSKQI